MVPSKVNVSCTITQTYGYLNISITYPPAPPTITQVKTGYTFDINATIMCEGTVGSSCGNVTATPRYANYSINFHTNAPVGV